MTPEQGQRRTRHLADGLPRPFERGFQIVRDDEGIGGGCGRVLAERNSQDSRHQEQHQEQQPTQW
ncbi:MAG: hypothetical protein IPL78_25370 [Chloroflexi bacterium]|nr:hypothetical protein [Chloroflexota bacterium]